MNPLFTLGEEFRFHSSRFHKKAGDAKFWFYHSFVPVLIGTLAETLIYKWERVERVPTLWLQTTPQETARWWHWTVRFVWCPFLGLERYIEFRLPKAVLPSTSDVFAQGALPGDGLCSSSGPNSLDVIAQSPILVRSCRCFIFGNIMMALLAACFIYKVRPDGSALMKVANIHWQPTIALYLAFYSRASYTSYDFALPCAQWQSLTLGCFCLPPIRGLHLFDELHY